MVTLDRARGRTPTELIADAIAAIEELSSDSPRAEVLRAFPGWGRLPKLFTSDDGTKAMVEARQRFGELLSDMDLATARASTLNMMFTPDYLVSLMWRAVSGLGFTGGAVLDIGCGIGQFGDLMPDVLRDRTQYVGIEKDASAAAIARKLNPEANIYRGDALTWKYPKGKFNLVIGNIPFEDGVMAGYGAFKPKVALHARLILKAIEMLAPGGIICLLTTTGTMDSRGRNGEYNAFRQTLVDAGSFLGAVRIPGEAFSSTGKTTDLILWQKPNDNGFRLSPDIVESVPTPLLTPDNEPIHANRYFMRYPHRMLGEPYPDRCGFATDFGTRWPDGFGQDLAVAIEAALMRLVQDASFSVQAQTIHALAETGDNKMLQFRTPPPPVIDLDETPIPAPIVEPDLWIDFQVGYNNRNMEVFFGNGREYAPPRAIREELGTMGFRFTRKNGGCWYGPVNALSFPYMEQLSVDHGASLKERSRQPIHYATWANLYGPKAEDDLTPDDGSADYAIWDSDGSEIDAGAIIFAADDPQPMADPIPPQTPQTPVPIVQPNRPSASTGDRPPTAEAFQGQILASSPALDTGDDFMAQLMSGAWDDLMLGVAAPNSIFTAEYLAELQRIRATRCPMVRDIDRWIVTARAYVQMTRIAMFIERTMAEMPSAPPLADVPLPPDMAPAPPVVVPEPTPQAEVEDAAAPPKAKRWSVD